MRALLVVLVTTLLVPAVSGQDSPAPMQDSLPPFKTLKEIIPGLMIPNLINAAGGVWQQERVIDSMAYACTDFLPYLGSIIREVHLGSLYWGPICDQVVDAADDLEAFDVEGSCNKLIYFLNDTYYRGGIGKQTEIPQEYNFDIVGILRNVTRDLYGIDFYDQSTICPNVLQFLESSPSLPSVTTRFTAELISAVLPKAFMYICKGWEEFLQSVGIVRTSPYYQLIHDGADTGSKLLGYESRADICTAMVRALSIGEERRVFGRNAFESVLNIVTDVDRCLTIGNDAVDDIIRPLGYTETSGFKVNSSMIQRYTGFKGVQEICTALDTAFTAVIDLPDAIPIRFLPDPLSMVTLEFLIESTGGIWLQDRTIDSLAFACTNIIPDLESMSPDLTNSSKYYGPICREVLTATSDLEAFDIGDSCNYLISLIMYLTSNNRDSTRRQPEMPQEDYFDIVGILDDIARSLYGIDFSDESTCPQIKQFLEPSLPDITTRFTAELVSAVLPEAVMYICQDWEEFLQSVGIVRTSPYYQLIHDGADIGSRMLGYESRSDICTALGRVLSSGGEERRVFGRNAFESVLNIFTDVDRCLTIGNDAVDDVIQPLIDIEIPRLKVSSYVIQRFSGFEGVQEICTALETAFTKLSGSTVMLTITGEALNGEELVYTADLTNRESSYFKELERVFCGVVENHLTKELGSDLRRLNCTVVSFSPGSVVAELELEVFATTHDFADSLAQDVVDLSTSDSLTLSSDGDSLTVSSFSATATIARGRGLSTGAIIGIAVGVVVVVVVLLAIICRKSPEGSRKSPKGSRKSPDGSRKSPEGSRKSPEVSQKV